MAAVLTLATASALLKLMFIPAYRSTDFEVHRNWLAITHSLPVSKWYVEDTSEWTLDYPPLFAWFEWILSQVAAFVDPGMLQVTNLNYASDATVMFQRVSVILTDFVYYYAIKEFQELAIFNTNKQSGATYSAHLIPILLIFNFGLFIVDHIHFQYNGILFGIMLLSIVRILQERTIEGAFWFSVLLNMKHIFMYIAPAYFVYLLRTYCFNRKKPVSLFTFSKTHFVNLASIVLMVFGISFGPFIYHHQIGQVLSRLFPFKRGLVHAYWAPNMWALYNGLDKLFTIVGLKFGCLHPHTIPKASMTGGMVQEFSHMVMPSIAPLVTMILSACAMVPALVLLWDLKSPLAFVRAIVLCAFSSFLFGWHVHEKAILMIIIPMTLLVKYSQEDAKLFLILSTTGFASLFPLLFTPFENIIKVLLLLQATIFAFLSLKDFYGKGSKSSSMSSRSVLGSTLGSSSLALSLREFHLPLLNILESIYLWGLVGLNIFNSGFPTWLLGLDIMSRLPFLPLMLTSVYCAVGVIYCWLYFYFLLCLDAESSDKQQKSDRCSYGGSDSSKSSSLQKKTR
ncbi:alpha-1,3-glucosyltransferase [Plakobranchus ocellatus]|uniref:Alpha-1,3-glucosyltransferase n=1 Tax=Plakobranchus ocellatus TaxID=259542 RepID=A0AAV3Y5I2_9GAST|nr:alpha-1,3-glucosyltransferase [Plakobranchus ocellatus]